MSFDLTVFDKAKAPDFFEDFLNWKVMGWDYREDSDYDSIEGTAPKLTAWFMEMKETFPPLNGPYSPCDDEAFKSDDSEKHLTDYSIGSDVIYGAFGWSVAEEAAQLAEKLAGKHDVGLFNPQTGDIICVNMVFCKIRTEKQDDKIVIWEQIEKEILTLDDT
jgi:hypothetical protein